MQVLRAVWIKKLCYVWIPEANSFIKLVGLDNSITKSELQSNTGFTEAQQSKK